MRSRTGLFVADRHNPSQGDRISARGLGVRAAFGVRGVKVVLDGVPLTMPDGQTQLNNLDLGSAGRIEILRGPGSALYGNASGGLISIRTQTATIDASLGLRRPFLGTPAEFFLGLDNLFAARYSSSIVPNAFGDRFFEPAPGRTWHLGIQISLGR